VEVKDTELAGQEAEYCRCGNSKAMRMRKDRYRPTQEPNTMRRMAHHGIFVDEDSLFFMDVAVVGDKLREAN
jgi:hypothetical protein